MSAGHGDYDHKLLAATPAATKSQLQEGYTTEILAPPRPEASNSLRDVEASKERLAPAPTQPVPFWRTKKGMIIIAIAAIVIVAAVVGGAVGGTQANRNSNNANTLPGTNGTQEVGQDSTLPTPTNSSGQSTTLPFSIPSFPTPSNSDGQQQENEPTDNSTSTTLERLPAPSDSEVVSTPQDEQTGPEGIIGDREGSVG